MTLDFWLSTAGWLGSEFIYIPLIILFSSYIAYDLFQKHPSENKILHILLFITTLPILTINIAYSVSYFPEVIYQKEFNHFKYYIVWGIDIDYHSHLSFYKCEQWSIKCDDPYRDYSQLNFDKIVIDKEKNEVSAVRSMSDLGLAFTYGENSRRYEGHPERLGEHVYQMAIDDHAFETCVATSCDIYTYTLYECSLDYTSCNPFPIQYSTTYDDVIFLDSNEITNEINASNSEDTLIFTYGKHPVCYVDGCVILSP